MCNFFSFVTNPDHDNDFYFFDWQMRQADKDGADSHSHICAQFKLNEDKINKWEYNPLTKELTLDGQNAEKDDEKRVRKWVDKLDWKQIVEPLIFKPIVNPFELPAVETASEKQIGWLIEWDSVMASVRDSVVDSVMASVRASVWYSVVDSVWDSVRDSVVDSVMASVWDSVVDLARAYISSFFAIKFDHDYSPAVKLWEAGLVPSFDGTTWRLHTGKDAHVVYEWNKQKETE